MQSSIKGSSVGPKSGLHLVLSLSSHAPFSVMCKVSETRTLGMTFTKPGTKQKFGKLRAAQINFIVYGFVSFWGQVCVQVEGKSSKSGFRVKVLVLYLGFYTRSFASYLIIRVGSPPPKVFLFEQMEFFHHALAMVLPLGVSILVHLQMMI